MRIAIRISRFKKRVAFSKKRPIPRVGRLYVCGSGLDFRTPPPPGSGRKPAPPPANPPSTLARNPLKSLFLAELSTEVITHYKSGGNLPSGWQKHPSVAQGSCFDRCYASVFSLRCRGATGSTMISSGASFAPACSTRSTYPRSLPCVFKWKMIAVGLPSLMS